jgi:hypothetical protein
VLILLVLDWEKRIFNLSDLLNLEKMGSKIAAGEKPSDLSRGLGPRPKFDIQG